MDLSDDDLREALQEATKRPRRRGPSEGGRLKRLRRGGPSGRSGEPEVPAATAAPPEGAEPAEPETGIAAMPGPGSGLHEAGEGTSTPGEIRAECPGVRAPGESFSSESGVRPAGSFSLQPRSNPRAGLQGRGGRSGGRGAPLRLVGPTFEGFDEIRREVWEALGSASAEALLQEGMVGLAKVVGSTSIVCQRAVREEGRLKSMEEGLERAISEVRRLQAEGQRFQTELLRVQAESETALAERDHLRIQLGAAEDTAERAERAARHAREERTVALAKLEGAQKTRDGALSQVRSLLSEQATLFGSLAEAKARAEEAGAQSRDALARAAVAEAEVKQARLSAARSVEDFQKSAQFRKVVASCSMPMAFRGFRIAKRAIAALHPDLDLRDVCLTAELMDSVRGGESEQDDGEESDGGSGSDEASGDGTGSGTGVLSIIAAVPPTDVSRADVVSAGAGAGAATAVEVTVERVIAPGEIVEGPASTGMTAEVPAAGAEQSGVVAAGEALPPSPLTAMSPSDPFAGAPLSEVVMLDVEDAADALLLGAAPAVRGSEEGAEILID